MYPIFCHQTIWFNSIKSFKNIKFYIFLKTLFSNNFEKIPSLYSNFEKKNKKKIEHKIPHDFIFGNFGQANFTKNVFVNIHIGGFGETTWHPIKFYLPLRNARPRKIWWINFFLQFINKIKKIYMKNSLLWWKFYEFLVKIGTFGSLKLLYTFRRSHVSSSQTKTHISSNRTYHFRILHEICFWILNETWLFCWFDETW